MVLECNTKYQATVKLSFLESLATNQMIAEKFAAVGFKNVLVTGSGQQRKATGLWTEKTQEVKTIPAQVSNIVKV